MSKLHWHLIINRYSFLPNANEKEGFVQRHAFPSHFWRISTDLKSRIILKRLLTIICSALFILPTGHHSEDFEHRLIYDLFKSGYSKEALPVTNKSEAIEVMFDMAYSQLIYLVRKLRSRILTRYHFKMRSLCKNAWKTNRNPLIGANLDLRNVVRSFAFADQTLLYGNSMSRACTENIFYCAQQDSCNFRPFKRPLATIGHVIIIVKHVAGDIWFEKKKLHVLISPNTNFSRT